MRSSRGRRAACAALLLAAFVGGPLAAEQGLGTESGTRIPQPKPAAIPTGSSLSEADRAQAVTEDFSACVVLRHRAAIKQALALSPLSADGHRRLAALATPDCLAGGELRIPQTVMRGMLFVALYRADFRAASPALSPDPVDYAKDLGGAENEPDGQAYVAIRQFGECVLRADPTGVRSLVLAAPGSAQERTALAELNPKLGNCLDRGANFTFSKIMLIGVLAETLYRVSRPA
jgi:hypothetical protein